MAPETVDRALIATMEAMLLASFPALDTEQHDGLFVGSTMGVTGRANSAVVVDEIADISATVDWATNWLTERDRKPLFRLSPLAPPALAGLLPMHTAFNATTCMHLSLADPPAAPVPGAVEISSMRPGDWIREGTDERGREVDALMNNVTGELAWAVIRSERSTVAAGRGVLVDGWLCVQSVYTLPGSRGNGFAGQIVVALHEWAAARNATDAFLNVGTTNVAAQSVYRSLGYRAVYEYRYVPGLAD